MAQLRAWKLKSKQGDKTRINELYLKAVPGLKVKAAEKRISAAFKYGFCERTLYSVISKYYKS